MKKYIFLFLFSFLFFLPLSVHAEMYVGSSNSHIQGSGLTEVFPTWWTLYPSGRSLTLTYDGWLHDTNVKYGYLSVCSNADFTVSNNGSSCSDGCITDFNIVKIGGTCTINTGSSSVGGSNYFIFYSIPTWGLKNADTLPYYADTLLFTPKSSSNSYIQFNDNFLSNENLYDSFAVNDKINDLLDKQEEFKESVNNRIDKFQTETNNKFNDLQSSMDKNKQDILDNQDKNKQEIVDNQDKNNQDLMDNNNKNKDEIIENQDKNNEELKDKLDEEFKTCRPSKNLILGSNTITDDISVGQGTIIDTDLFGGIKGIKTNKAWFGRYINLQSIANRKGFKVGDKLVLSVYIKADQEVTGSLILFRFGNTSLGSIEYKNVKITSSWQKISYTFIADEDTINKTTTRIEFDRDTNDNYIYWAGWQLEIGDTASSYEIPGEEVCTNKMDETNDKLDGIQGSITDSNTSEAENKADSFFSNFDNNDYGLSDVISMPLSMIKNITSAKCTPLQIPIPFVDTNVSLPCMNTIYSQYFGSILTIYQTITTGMIGYWVCINIFAMVKGFKDPDNDNIEVMEL